MIVLFTLSSLHWKNFHHSPSVQYFMLSPVNNFEVYKKIIKHDVCPVEVYVLITF